MSQPGAVGLERVIGHPGRLHPPVHRPAYAPNNPANTSWEVFTTGMESLYGRFLKSAEKQYPDPTDEDDYERACGFDPSFVKFRNDIDAPFDLPSHLLA